MDRPKCSIEGCKNLAKKNCLTWIDAKGNKCVRKGNPYLPMCNSHTDQRVYGTDKCILCGWNKARCDKHRLKVISKSGKRPGYYKANVISLCPNCHRLVHLGFVTLN